MYYYRFLILILFYLSMGPIETWGPGALNRSHRGFYGTAADRA